MVSFVRDTLYIHRNRETSRPKTCYVFKLSPRLAVQNLQQDPAQRGSVTRPSDPPVPPPIQHSYSQVVNHTKYSHVSNRAPTTGHCSLERQSITSLRKFKLCCSRRASKGYRRISIRVVGRHGRTRTRAILHSQTDPSQPVCAITNLGYRAV